MAPSGGLGKGELTFKRRGGGSVEDIVGCERSVKKARLNSRSSRKRAWSEVEGGDVVDASASRKISRGDVTERGEEHRGVSESSVTASGIMRHRGEKPSRGKWKRMTKSGDNDDDGSSAQSLKGELGNGNQSEVVRKVLQTVHLEETRADREGNGISLENDHEFVSEQSGREKKRRGSSPSQQPEKKLRIASSSWRKDQGDGVLGTWRRRMKGCKATRAVTEEMGVSVSEAWKRLRDETDTGTSRSSVNGRSDSDVSMHSSDSEMIESERAKKARHDDDLPLLPSLSQGRKWRRKTRDRKESSHSASKRLREGGGSDISSSGGSSGSDISHPSYYHNRKWKRPRFEYIMSMQGRSWRKQARDVDDDDARVVSLAEIFKDGSFEKPTKRQRK